MNSLYRMTGVILLGVFSMVASVQAEEVAVIETTKGTIEFTFMEDKAPRHVKNFKDLANKKFYDGTAFHRVMPGFMIQGGDPNS